MSELQNVRQEISSIKMEAQAAKEAGNEKLLIAYQQQLVPLREKEERLAREAASAGEICMAQAHTLMRLGYGSCPHLPLVPTFTSAPLSLLPTPT
jgi:hypothetical protein